MLSVKLCRVLLREWRYVFWRWGNTLLLIYHTEKVSVPQYVHTNKRLGKNDLGSCIKYFERFYLL